MSRHTYAQSTQSPGALTSEQVERIRTALRSAAGEYAEALELTAETGKSGEALELSVQELEERALRAPRRKLAPEVRCCMWSVGAVPRPQPR